MPKRIEKKRGRRGQGPSRPGSHRPVKSQKVVRRRDSRRNLFEVDNARNLTRDELVATFVPTQSFWRLLSAKNHVILGSRGSGKTAIVRMLAHDHLSKLKDEAVRELVADRKFIGIYLPTRLEWVGGLKNKLWQSDEEGEFFFQWRLNIASCLAFLTTLKSCLDCYFVDRGLRALKEAEIVQQLAYAWVQQTENCETVTGLQRLLEDIEYERQQMLIAARVRNMPLAESLSAGLSFGADLFLPLRRAITLTSRVLDIPDESSWLLCIDEAEFLQPEHQKALNSQLRAYSGNLFFKITTMPYCHYTLATNVPVPLDVGHDFEYVYIDPDPVVLKLSDDEQGVGVDKRTRIGTQFARTLFNKRAEIYGGEFGSLSLGQLLGTSVLLDEKRGAWTKDSREMALLRRYASPETWQRAERLRTNSKRFQSEMVRKLHGALLLRDAVEKQKGRAELDVYSGATMAIRCGDANPRQLIRIFNSLLLEVTWYRTDNELRPRRLGPRAQTRVLTKFSTSVLNRVQSEPQVGPQLYDFILMLGTYMHTQLFEHQLTTDQVSSVRLATGVTAADWAVIKRAVGLGLLFPNVSANHPDEMPEREGTFHLAYVLAPRFRILPRRGRSRSLSTIRAFWAQRRPPIPGWLDEEVQGELFP